MRVSDTFGASVGLGCRRRGRRVAEIPGNARETPGGQGGSCKAGARKGFVAGARKGFVAGARKGFACEIVKLPVPLSYVCPNIDVRMSDVSVSVLGILRGATGEASRCSREALIHDANCVLGTCVAMACGVRWYVMYDTP